MNTPRDPHIPHAGTGRHYQAGARSIAAHVRNPLLDLPSARRIRALPPDTRMALADLLGELSRDARDRAERSWRRHKAPMAAYWKAVSVYAAHLRRVVHPVKGEGGQNSAPDGSSRSSRSRPVGEGR